MNMLGDSFGTAYTLGRHYSLKVFPNRAARHSRATYSPKVFPNSAMRHTWATLCHFFVAGEFALKLS